MLLNKCQKFEHVHKRSQNCQKTHQSCPFTNMPGFDVSSSNFTKLENSSLGTPERLSSSLFESLFCRKLMLNLDCLFV